MHTVNANALREFSKHTVQPVGLVTIHLPPKRALTVTDWTLMAGDVLEIDINAGTIYTLTEGVDFDAEVSNYQTAVNLAEAINALAFGALPRVRARAEFETDRVIVAGGATTQSLSFDLSGISGLEELVDPAPTERKFFLADRTVMGPEGGGGPGSGEWGGYPLSVANIPKPVSHTLDAMTREFASGDRDIEWIDDGEIRRILLDQHLRGRRVDLSLGTPRLDEADFHPLGGRFFVQDCKPDSSGAIQMQLHDASGFFKDNQIAKRWVNEHPITIFDDALETVALQWGLGAGTSALDELVDRTTLVPSVEPETAHHTISRYGGNEAGAAATYESGNPLDEPEPLIDVMNELLLLLGGTFSPDVDGRFRYRPYDPDAAPVRTWQAAPETGYDVADVVVKDLWGNIANEIAVDFAESDAHGGQKTRFVQRSESSRNEVGRLFNFLLETEWCNGVSKHGAFLVQPGNQRVIGSASTDFPIPLAARQGFTGSRFRLQGDGSFLPENNGDLDGAASPPRRAFLRLHGPGREAGTLVSNNNLPPEIICCDDSEPEGNVPDADNVRGDIPLNMRYHVATTFNDYDFTNGRAGFGTSTPHQWGHDPSGDPLAEPAWIVDITVPVHMVLRRLPRFQYGAPVLEVHTGLDQIAIEVGDFIAIDGDHVYMTLGKDGLTTTTVFEVTRVDVDPWGESPGIVFEVTWVRDDVVPLQTFTPSYPDIDIPVVTTPDTSRVLTESFGVVLTDSGGRVLVG